MTDRDTFAAAALTGLLGGPGDKDFSMDYWARHAYEAADAMLRERERVTEPMPKEKRAEVSSAPVFSDKAGSWPVSYDKTDLMDEAADEIERLRNGALDSRETVQQEPVAWAAMLPERIATFDRKMLFGRTPTDVRLYGEALNCCVDVFPLYRAPTLTAEELAAIAGAIESAHSRGACQWADTLRSLLERTK
ncbi:MAG: hypothetical protein EBR82_50270 [Caulobacteraceae bacterium]|nr:hypothetical protein [Caulobacteraceae bacterium]